MSFLGSPWYLSLDYLQDVVAISKFPLLWLCVSLVLPLDRLFYEAGCSDLAVTTFILLLVDHDLLLPQPRSIVIKSFNSTDFTSAGALIRRMSYQHCPPEAETDTVSNQAPVANSQCAIKVQWLVTMFG